MIDKNIIDLIGAGYIIPENMKTFGNDYRYIQKFDVTAIITVDVNFKIPVPKLDNPPACLDNRFPVGRMAVLLQQYQLVGARCNPNQCFNM